MFGKLIKVEIPEVTKLQVELKDLAERVKRLECPHYKFNFIDSKIRVVHVSLFGDDIYKFGPYKKCLNCGKEIDIEDRCEWLNQKHAQEKAQADATAQQLKKCV